MAASTPKRPRKAGAEKRRQGGRPSSQGDPVEANGHPALDVLLERVSDGIVVLDRDWRYVFINPAGAALFGHKPEDLLGKHIWTEFPEGVGQPFHQAYEQAMATQQPIVLEDYYAPWDRWFENRIYPSPDALTIIYHEITERKRAEIELRRERDLNASVMEASPVGIAIVERDGRISYANARAESILGLTRAGITARSYDTPAWRITSFDGTTFPMSELPVARVLATGEAVTGVQHAIEWPDGRRVYLEVSASPLQDDAGAVSGVVASFEDVSRQKRDRDALAAQTRVLAAIAGGSSLPDTLALLVQELEWLSPGILGSILLLDEDGIHVRHGAAPHLPRDYVRAIDGLPIGPAAGSCGTAMYRRQAVVVEDILADSLWDEYRAFTAPFGLRSCWSTPILDDRGGVLGSFAMYTRAPARPTAEHQRVIELATSLAGIAIARARKEAAARETTDRLRLTVQGTGTGLWDWDLASNRVRFSTEWKAQLGYADDEIGDAFEEWHSRVHPDDVAGAVARVQAYLREPHEGFEHEFRLRHKDGSWRWIVARAAVIRGPGGAPARMIGTHLDVTERRIAEQRLRDSERQLRQILDSMFTFVALLSPDGVVLEVNRAPLEAAGLRREDLVGKPVTESYWWAYAPEPLARLRDAVERAGRGEAVRFDQLVRIGEEQFLTIDVTFAPLRDDAGQVVGIVASASDITERKRAEAAVRASEAQLRLFVEAAPVAVAMFDREMRYLVHSGRWRADYRLGSQEVVGRSHYDVFPDIPEAWKHVHRRALAGEVVGAAADRFERSDGSVQWLRWEVRPWRTADGTIGGIVIATDDVTARVEAEQRLRESHEQLRLLAAAQERTREAERTRIARELHDELGQALTGLKMDLAWLRARLPADPALAERTAAMGTLLDETVAFGRRLAAELRPGVLDDLGLVPALRWLAREFAQRSGLAVAVDAPESLDVEPERATAVFRIVQEALTNVARHAAATSVRLTVEAPKGTLTVAVEDDGHGIVPDLADRAATLGVLGMRERAEAWGGELSLTPAPGGGTRVTVRMPLAPGAIEAHP